MSSGGLSFLAHYTFSKFLDDVEAANEYGSTGSYMDAYNRRLDKGPSGSDVPQRLMVTLLYEVPQVQGQSLREGVLGGWRVGLLETAESGPPFTVITTANTTNAFPAGSLRPNLLRDASLSGDQRTSRTGSIPPPLQILRRLPSEIRLARACAARRW